MTIFKKTILGKILGGVAKVIKPVAVVAGAVLGIGAISGVVKGIGAAAGVATELKGIAKVVSKVTQSAVNLVTGTTKEERTQVAEVKAEAKAAQDKLDQVERLVQAGATRLKAEAMVGITASELGAANSAEKDAETQARLKAEGLGITGGYTGITATTAGKGCLVTSLIIISALAAMAFTILIF